VKPPTVLVGMLCVEWMYTKTVGALLGLRLPPGSGTRFEVGVSSIAAKRQRLAEMFLRTPEFTHLLFLDSDQTPAPDTVERLLRHDLPIVGAAIFTRIPPHHLCAWRFLPNSTDAETLGQLGAVERVDSTGCGCLLIRRDAMLTIPQPWFEHPPAQPGIAEDGHFCRQARVAGIPIHVDTSLVVGHLTVTAVDFDYVAGWAQTQQARQAEAAHPGFTNAPGQQSGGVHD
jgi:hypothetical protein